MVYSCRRRVFNQSATHYSVIKTTTIKSKQKLLRKIFPKLTTKVRELRFVLLFDLPIKHQIKSCFAVKIYSLFLNYRCFILILYIGLKTRKIDLGLKT